MLELLNGAVASRPRARRDPRVRFASSAPLHEIGIASDLRATVMPTLLVCCGAKRHCPAQAFGAPSCSKQASSTQSRYATLKPLDEQFIAITGATRRNRARHRAACRCTRHPPDARLAW
jgi:hypothetical protein